MLNQNENVVYAVFFLCLCSKLLHEVHQPSVQMPTADGLHHPDHQHFLRHQRRHVSKQLDLMPDYSSANSIVMNR